MSSTTPQLDPVDGPEGGPEDEPVDGRTARAVRTRLALVDATIELVEGGDLRPTAPRIAERAGVSVRSVFQHFDDLETLFSAMGERVVERIALLIEPISTTLPTDERIALLVEQRCRVNEALTPINRAAVLHLPASATISRQFNDGHRFMSALVEEVVEPELRQVGKDRAVLLDALVIAVSWPTWNLLRSYQARSIDDAALAVAGTVNLVLDGAGVVRT